MRILIYNRQNIWEHELEGAFESLGFEVKVAFPSTIYDFQSLIESFLPHIVLSLGTPIKYIYEIFEYIGEKKRQRPYIYMHWDTEGMKNFNLTQIVVEKTQPDIVLTISKEVEERMHEKEIKSYVLPYGVNLKIHHPLADKLAYAGIFSMIATNYRPLAEDFRKKTLRTLVYPLLEAGISIEARGYSWHTETTWVEKGLKPMGYWNYLDINRVYNGAFANLLLQNYDDAMTKRTFEVLGAGGFIITYASSIMKKTFTNGKELLMSSSPGETLEIVQYYQTHPEEYWGVRMQAAKRAEEFTYTERLRVVLGEAGIIKEVN